MSVLLYMKVTLQQAWPLHNDLLGAPFGQSLQDYPLGDPIQIVLTKLIGIFTSDVALATNVFFLLTFPLSALSALWVFRRLGVETPVAVACSVLFALTPFHFFRGEDHLMIAAYYAVPLSCFLILRQLTGQMPRLRTTVICAALVGAAFTYYVVFTLILLALATLVSFAGGRRPAARDGLVALAVIGAVAFAAHLPTWIYNLSHGSNQAVASLRNAEQSERFGLKIPRLIFPVEGHRLKPLADLTRRIDERGPTDASGKRVLAQLQEGTSQALGLAGAIGFVWLIWLALSRTFLEPRGIGRDPYVQAAGFGALATTLLGLAGGASLVIAYSVTPLVRSWSRLSILISFFALVAVAKLLEAGIARLRARGVGSFAVAGILLLFTGLAVAEQTNSRMVPAYDELASAWSSQKALASVAAARLPKDSFVVQIPYAPFPETEYREAAPFLHTNDLRWTFGAMSGRPEDWTASFAGMPTGLLVNSAAASGASGFYVDRASYGGAGPKIKKEVDSMLGRPIVEAPDVALYDLRGYAAALTRRLGARTVADVRYRVLHPVRVEPGSELSALQVSATAGPTNRISYGPSATVDLINPLPGPREVDLTIALSATNSVKNFAIEMPDGRRLRFEADPDASGSGRVTLRPGRNKLRITALGKPALPQNSVFSIDGLAVFDRRVTQAFARAAS